MPANIVLGTPLETLPDAPPRYYIPLKFQNPTQQSEIEVSIGNTSFLIFFNQNILINTLFMSAYTINRATVYFLSYQCGFGNYINKIDNGCPYLLYFLDKSNGQNYSKNSVPITYDLLSNGVQLYAELR